ncbi:putative C-type lectin domain family 4 member E-like isoform 2 [Scophthalmus maximus]|uniref:Putative C-type lectin domain family 4 member E-like isoform 2 n=1 Tax=Scophthalmus maximus TaxID=52904 RepID=A0A2U9AXV6_SCOMX|nr:C-type lectin domain family 9 member A isoform X1 [Scophthalmus maximus]AWO96446.1 putative C-type lectin domain family 4 member E-like isoform 2 [Scophthalmus maximus]KAF0045503.1 hypothetical protein F2P81_002032 [Scophthalmus maximus]
MEMEDIATEKERNIEDEGASESMLAVKTEEEAQPDVYCKLKNPAEDVYAEAYFGESPLKKGEDKQTEGNARLYRAGCLILTIICLVLLLLVIVLSMKLQSGSEVCPEREETAAAADKQNPSVAPTCDYEQCKSQFSNTEAHRCGCQQCADGWQMFGRTCFYLSTIRLNWDQSQRNCTARGGSLAVITSQGVQDFLTKKGNLKYWIGLRRDGDNWSWVSNSPMQERYWAEDVSSGDCGFLSSESPTEKNWNRASCQFFTYFICQVQI